VGRALAALVLKRVPWSHLRSRIHSTGAGHAGLLEDRRVPIPMHWDLPEWERDRVRAVIEPAVVVDEKSRWELEARANGESRSPLPQPFPHANGICSSGSTACPK